MDFAGGRDAGCVQRLPAWRSESRLWVSTWCSGLRVHRVCVCVCVCEREREREREREMPTGEQEDVMEKIWSS